MVATTSESHSAAEPRLDVHRVAKLKAGLEDGRTLRQHGADAGPQRLCRGVCQCFSRGVATSNALHERDGRIEMGTGCVGEGED